MKLSNSLDYLDKHQGSCPIGCKYCAVTKIDSRRELWQKKSIIGLNKAVSIINPPFDRANKEAMKDFYNFPSRLLYADIIGFNATTDPFWPKYQPELDHFMKKYSPLAKLIVCVTKFNPPDEVLKELSQYPNFRLNVSITGLDMLENTKTKNRLDLLSKCKKHNIKALPVIHPYIAGMSDLSFLQELKNIGYDHADIKGLRYNHANMQDWMTPESQEYYIGTQEKEILIEDGWRQKFSQNGIRQISIKDWYFQDGDLYPKLDYRTAKANVEELLKYANITSSDSDEAVVEASIRRRL